MIQAKTLAGLDGVHHRFFSRRGGVSAGLYSSLNCGYGSADQPANVRENRRRAAAAFDLAETELLTMHQIHSTDVLTVADRRWTSPGAPKADAMVTDRPGVALGVLAADCAPVLLADPRAGVIGAAPAGRDRSLHRPRVLRSRTGIPRAVPGAGRRQRCLLPGRAARRPFPVRSRGLSRPSPGARRRVGERDRP